MKVYYSKASYCKLIKVIYNKHNNIKLRFVSLVQPTNVK